MKYRIIIMMLFILLVTGCYDYKELNNLYIVEGVAIDYLDNEYVVTYEIINTDKDNNEERIYKSGKGSIISEAFNNTNITLSKEPSLSHIKVLFISEALAKKGTRDILLYITREPSIPHILYPIITNDNARNFITSDTTGTSNAILRMIEGNDYIDSLVTHENFISFLNDVLNPLKDGYLNYVSLNDNEPIITGLALFKDDKLVTTLNKDEGSTLEVLNNKSKFYSIKVLCDNNKYINVGMYHNHDTKIIPKDNNITVNTSLNATILEDECNLDFREPKTIEDLMPVIETKLKEEFNSIYNKLLENNIDTLGIKDIFYKKTKNNNYNYINIEPTFNIQVNIKRNGLVFEVKPNA